MIRSLLTLPVVALAGSVAFAHPPAQVFVQPVPVYAPPIHHHHHAGYAPAPIPVYTLDNFAREFRPSEGHHTILIVHPVTCRPVEVCFTLPCGKLSELDVNRRSIHFDFGRHDVRISFRSNGSVDVRAD
jgi:hypothetical protein